jgi:hypothetical protein
MTAAATTPRARDARARTGGKRRRHPVEARGHSTRPHHAAKAGRNDVTA